MKAQIKLYPCLLAGHAVPAQGAAGDAAWPQPRLFPAGMRALSNRGSRRTGNALGATPFAFLKTIQFSQCFSSVAEAIHTHRTSIVSVLKFGKANIQTLLFLLWEEQKVSDIPGKPVGEC